MTGLVLLFIGDEHEADLNALPSADFVIAADQGVKLAERARVHVDLLIGDLDSVTADVIAAAEGSATRIERHSAEKEKTDVALGLDAAREWGASSVVVVGGGAGRLDHLIANYLLLASADYAQMHIQARLGRSRVTVVRSEASLAGERDSLVTLLAVGGPARVRTMGLRYRLTDEVLEPGSSRGVSNALAGPSATVWVSEGVVLAIQPGSEEGSSR